MSERSFLRPSMWALIAANIAVIAVAFFLRWSLADLMTLYWLELAIPGVIALAQIRRAARIGMLQKSRGYLGILFVAHYGTFCVLYRAALKYIFSGSVGGESWFWLVAWLPLACLAAAHVVSYRKDFLPHEAMHVSPFNAMWIPYRRVLPVYLPMLCALWVSPTSGQAGAAVLLFGAGKTIADVVVQFVFHGRRTPIL